MKILMINVTCGTGSTGRICTDLAEVLERNGHNVKIAYGRDNVPKKSEKYAIKIGNNLDIYTHVLRSRLFDDMGFGSKHATETFLKWVDKFDPDVVHLHNIHGYYINIELLFEYLIKKQKKVIWTLHDCWSFTGHCAYFDYVGCNKWINGCRHCSQRNEYPARLFLDKSKEHYFKKKELFTSLKDVTLVTPSDWLADLVRKSYLKKYKVITIHNGINTDVFKYRLSDFKQQYGLEKKKIVLGVTSVWDTRKGLNIFYELSDLLSDDYKIVLVGLNKKQIKHIPDNIIGIEKTENIIKLAEIYSAAFVFVNPTFEDNYPTTNLEAIACGTPVITFDTGGSRESASNYGIVLHKKNAYEIVKNLNSALKIKYHSHIKLDCEDMLKQYIKLYNGQI